MAKKKPKKKRTYRQQPKIRWTKSQVQRLKETVDAYNKNVRRVKRRKDVGQYAPPTEKFKELKMQISSANELNRIVKQLNKFAKIKGKPEMYTNPHGVTMTQWLREKIKSDTLAENRRRMANTARIEGTEVYDFSGNVIPNARREQLKNENRLIQAKPETLKSVETFADLQKNLRRMAYLANPDVQLERLQQNMIKGIKKAIGLKGRKYIRMIRDMPLEELEIFYLENESMLEDFFNYESLKQAEIASAKDTEDVLEEEQPTTFEEAFSQDLDRMLGLRPKKQKTKKSNKKSKKKKSKK